jgi:hypothetical protein
MAARRYNMYSSTLDTTKHEYIVDFKEIEVFNSHAQALSSTYGFVPYGIVPDKYLSYFGNNGPAYFYYTDPPQWVIYPEVKVQVDPNLNRFTNGTVLSPGDTGYVNPSNVDLDADWMWDLDPGDIPASGLHSGYTQRIKVKLYEGACLSFKFKFITDYGDYTY